MTQQTDRLNAALAGRYHVERELGTERFPSEIKTTAKLQDAHILPLLDSGDAGGLRYYVMPVVTGETLRTRLERETQLPIDDAVRIARETGSALDYAHRQGAGSSSGPDSLPTPAALHSARPEPAVPALTSGGTRSNPGPCSD